MEIGLVSCTKSKRDSASIPAELYDESALFRKARAYTLENHDKWFILSAEHYLLEPAGEAIDPYENTLTTATKQEKKQWAEKTASELLQTGLVTPENTLVIHAGKAYHEELIPLLEHTGVTIEKPTDGLSFGKTLSWYNKQLPENVLENLAAGTPYMHDTERNQAELPTF